MSATIYDFEEVETTETRTITVEPGVVVTNDSGTRWEVARIVYVKPDGHSFFRFSHLEGHALYAGVRRQSVERIPFSENLSFNLTPAGR
jgi:hypothetical protein